MLIAERLATPDSPVTYGQKSDTSGALVRKFVPELSKLSDKYIYEPWKAAIVDQTKAGCLLGVGYPKVSPFFLASVLLSNI